MMGRPLTPTEVSSKRMERLMITATWGLKKLGRYTNYVPHVIVVVPHPVEVNILSKVDLPVRLQAQLVELSSFNCSFECGEGAWGLQNEIVNTRGMDLVAPLMAK